MKTLATILLLPSILITQTVQSVPTRVVQDVTCPLQVVSAIAHKLGDPGPRFLVRVRNAAAQNIEEFQIIFGSVKAKSSKFSGTTRKFTKPFTPGETMEISFSNVEPNAVTDVHKELELKNPLKEVVVRVTYVKLADGSTWGKLLSHRDIHMRQKIGNRSW